jgi:hypothetical protein
LFTAAQSSLLLGSSGHIAQVDRSSGRCFRLVCCRFGLLASGVVVLVVAGEARLGSGPVDHGRVSIGLVLEKDLFPKVIDALPSRTAGLSVLAVSLDLAHYARFSH